MTDDRQNLRRLSWALIAVAVGLGALHFILDAGADGEAPDWRIYAALVTALVATFVGLRAERSDR